MKKLDELKELLLEKENLQKDLSNQIDSIKNEIENYNNGKLIKLKEYLVCLEQSLNDMLLDYKDILDDEKTNIFKNFIVDIIKLKKDILDGKTNKYKYDSYDELYQDIEKTKELKIHTDYADFTYTLDDIIDAKSNRNKAEQLDILQIININNIFTNNKIAKSSQPKDNENKQQEPIDAIKTTDTVIEPEIVDLNYDNIINYYDNLYPITTNNTYSWDNRNKGFNVILQEPNMDKKLNIVYENNKEKLDEIINTFIEVENKMLPNILNEFIITWNIESASTNFDSNIIDFQLNYYDTYVKYSKLHMIEQVCVLWKIIKHYNGVYDPTTGIYYRNEEVKNTSTLQNLNIIQKVPIFISLYKTLVYDDKNNQLYPYTKSNEIEDLFVTMDYDFKNRLKTIGRVHVINGYEIDLCQFDIHFILYLYITFILNKDNK